MFFCPIKGRVLTKIEKNNVLFTLHLLMALDCLRTISVYARYAISIA